MRLPCTWRIHFASILSFKHLFPLLLKTEELNVRQRGQLIKILRLHVCFKGSLFNFVSLFGLLHISVSSLSVFASLGFYYICFPSFSLNLFPLFYYSYSPNRFCSLTFLSKWRSEASCCCLIWAVSSVLATTKRDSDGLGRLCAH